jgi:N-acetylneuraminic acid mutarotase
MFHAATLLMNGTVLVSGGFNWPGGTIGTSEVYDPASGSWTTTGSLSTSRMEHTATLLPDGKVLVSGGANDLNTSVDGTDVASAELYDSASGTWSTTGSLATARWGHAASLLPDGNVLVNGGQNAGGVLSSAELYNSDTGRWSATGSLANPRCMHTSTLMPSGNVMVNGGDNNCSILGSGTYTTLTSAELYDPSDGNWSATGPLTIGRAAQAATLLLDGSLLVSGGNSYVPSELCCFLPSSEIYF